MGLVHWELPANVEHPWKEYLFLDNSNSLTDNLTYAFVPLVHTVSFNSAYPEGGNDGAAWQGRGINSWGMAGIQADYGPINITLAPSYWYAQNVAFETMPSSDVFNNEFAYFTSNIDLPQRFGDASTGNVTAGESEVRFTWRTFTIGFSNQSLWLGPTETNPVLLSNNAPGFPRFDIGLRPTTTPVGTFEALAWWGVLYDSDYFDRESDADSRLFSGISLSYAPDLVPGLTFGVHRIVLQGLAGGDPADYFKAFNPFMTPELGRDATDQRASITADWTFPSVGFNVYVEWGRNDYSPRWSYIVRAPEHSQAFTYGLRQIVHQDARNIWLLSGEISQFIHSRDYDIDLGKSQNGFYTHGTVTQGHTNQGQLLGARIGPGADAQSLSLDYFYRRGRAGLFAERVSRNKDYIYGDPTSGPGDIRRMNVQMRYGAEFDHWIIRGLLLSGELSYAKNWNWNYETDNSKYNFYSRLGVSFRY